MFEPVEHRLAARGQGCKDELSLVHKRRLVFEFEWIGTERASNTSAARQSGGLTAWSAALGEISARITAGLLPRRGNQETEEVG